MLTKFKLVDVPEGGIDHLLPEGRVSINDQMTDAQAEACLALGLNYFAPVNAPANGDEKNGGKNAKVDKVEAK